MFKPQTLGGGTHTQIYMCKIQGLLLGLLSLILDLQSSRSTRCSTRSTRCFTRSTRCSTRYTRCSTRCTRCSSWSTRSSTIGTWRGMNKLTNLLTRSKLSTNINFFLHIINYFNYKVTANINYKVTANISFATYVQLF